ncbi:MAG: glycosyltransferase family 4 protein, partial [Acidimicrobiales bacterium]
MRVVHVAPTAFGAGGIFGGGERYPLELARAVARYVDCELVTFGGGGAGGAGGVGGGPPTEARTVREDGGLRVTTLRTLGRLGRHPAHPLGTGLVRRLVGADVVHAHHLWATPTRVAGAVTALARPALVVTDHGLLTSHPSRRLRRAVDRYLTVSRYSADVLALPPEKTQVIYGGADPARYHPDPDVGREGVLYVGRITPHKGIDTLIAALPPGATLSVAGTTGHDRHLPERAYPDLLRRLAVGHDVRFLGRVPDADLPDLHRRAQVLALPSLERSCYGARVPISELLGLTVLEAMASGTPVVASRVGGLPELVVDGVTGFLVEPGDVDQLQ